MHYQCTTNALSQSFSKHGITLTKEPILRKNVPKSHVVDYRRQPNLKDNLIQAKVPVVTSRLRYEEMPQTLPYMPIHPGR